MFALRSALLAALVALPSSASAVDAFPVLVGHGTAVIDGAEGVDEWAHGNRGLFQLATPLGGATWATIQFMDDGISMYWKVAVGPSEADWMVLGFNLDGDDDDLCESGDDLVYMDTNWGLLDYFQESGCSVQALDTTFGGTADGSCAWSVDGDGILVELSHPLDSADDAHDVSLGPHDACGFRLDVALCFYSNCTGNQPRPSSGYSSGRFVAGGVFLDGFETGDTGEWSALAPGSS